MSLLTDCAEYYISQGWGVIALYTIVNGKCDCVNPECTSPGKHPHRKLCPNGSSNATKDPAVVANWFKRNVNIGICTGADSGLCVLDVDPKNGGDSSLKKFILPKTVEVITGSGGRHFYFKISAGVTIKNSASTLGPGLDVRGDGGYVVAPPSVHIAGGEYRFKLDPRAVPLAEAPAWLYETKKADVSVEGDGETIGVTILAGTQHTTLVKLSGSMRKIGLTPREIYASLVEMNKRLENPAPEKNLRRIAEFTKKWEADNPSGELWDLDLTKMSDVKPRSVRWMWDPYIPFEEITLLMGPGGVGKSNFLTWVAGRVTTKGDWFLGNGSTVDGSVVMFSHEENMETQLAPKLVANGANRDRVFRVNMAVAAGGDKKSFFSMEMIDVLERKLKELKDVSLVTFDPITSYMDGVNANDNAEVRTTLFRLQELVRTTGIACVAVNHFNKKIDQELVNRGLGSVAFKDVVRSVCVITHDEDQDREWTGKYLFGAVKSNLSPNLPTTLKFKIQSDLALWWDAETIDSPIVRVMADKSSKGRENPKTVELKAWLIKRLGQGVAPPADLQAQAEAMGVSTATLYRLLNKLGAVQDQQFGGWRLPETPPV